MGRHGFGPEKLQPAAAIATAGCSSPQNEKDISETFCGAKDFFDFFCGRGRESVSTMKNPDVRWVQRFENYKKGLAQLQDAVELAGRRELSGLERQGLVQAFEFTHELAWKTLKDFLEDRGQAGLYGSRDATRAAFAAGLLADGDLWMAMIASRNQTSHTYNEETVEDITGAILRDYAPAFQALCERLARLEEEVG